MAAVIFLFTWIGLRLDEWLSLKQPYLTALFAVLGVFISVWQVIKGLIKPK